METLPLKKSQGWGVEGITQWAEYLCITIDALGLMPRTTCIKWWHMLVIATHTEWKKQKFKVTLYSYPVGDYSGISEILALKTNKQASKQRQRIEDVAPKMCTYLPCTKN